MLADEWEIESTTAMVMAHSIRERRRVEQKHLGSGGALSRVVLFRFELRCSEERR